MTLDTLRDEKLVSAIRVGSDLDSATAKAQYFVVRARKKEFLLRSIDFEMEQLIIIEI